MYGFQAARVKMSAWKSPMERARKDETLVLPSTVPLLWLKITAIIIPSQVQQLTSLLYQMRAVGLPPHRAVLLVKQTVTRYKLDGHQWQLVYGMTHFENSRLCRFE